MKYILCYYYLTISILFLSQISQSADLTGFGLGVTSTRANSDIPGWSIEPRSGYTLNYLLSSPIGKHWETRIAMSQLQKSFSVTNGVNRPLKYSLSYLEIPVAIGFRPLPITSFYAGLVFSFNFSNECNYSTGGHCAVPKSITENNFGNRLGISFNVFDEFAFDLAYTKYTAKLLDHVNEPSVLSLVFYILME